MRWGLLWRLEELGKMQDFDGGAVAHHDAVFDGGAEFSDIAGPRVGE